MSFSPRKRILRDITQRIMQNYVEADDAPQLPTPGVTPVAFLEAQRAASQLRYEQPSPWIPLTPPSSGRERSSRSGSVSPWKGFQTPTANTTRTSPRKRLLLTPEKASPGSSQPKKSKPDVLSPPLESALKGLSHDQLVNLIQTLATESPDIRSRISEILPLPDLQVLKEELKHLRMCVQKSLPTVSSRITSKTDSVAFSRAQVHIINLKKHILQTASTLVKSEYWTVVIDFVFLSWNQMRMTPNWDNDIHNDMKRKCYRVLSTHLGTALKNGEFSADEVVKITEQVKLLASDSPAMVACVNLIQSPKFKI